MSARAAATVQPSPLCGRTRLNVLPSLPTPLPSTPSRFGLFKESDGETALRFAKYVTVPAVIVSTLGDVTLQRWMLVFPAVALGYALLSGLAMLAMSWGRPRRERAQLLGSSVGAGVGLVGYPFIEATFGPTGET